MLAVALSLAAAAARADDGHGTAPRSTAGESLTEYVPGASRLEGRLLSPCCWEKNGGQTLDVHGSPVADQLRREIRRRLKAGETPEAVEADLVKRYTTRILAVPKDNPLPSVGPVLALGLAGGFGGAIWLILRWRRRASEAVGTPAPSAGAKDEWDRRLDAELDQPD
jgi:cytochrome c-type biogenesis protein CcmH